MAVFFGDGFVSNIRRNMLFYSILQSLGSASYIARITLARKFKDNGTFLCGRNALLLSGRKGLFRTINNTLVDTKRLFAYFKQRYTNEEIEDLNALVKLRGKLRSARFSLSFLSLCLTNRVAPKFITTRISKSGVRHGPTIERAFLQDEIQKTKTNILNLKRFSNLSDHSLSETETFVLGNGLEFCIPPQRINREELFAELEILHAQLARHDISDALEFNKLRARLSDLAHACSGSPIA